jgi:uncharacterized protein
MLSPTSVGHDAGLTKKKYEWLQLVCREREPMKKNIKLHLLEGNYAVSRLAPADAIPVWADGPGFVSISRATEELSVVCLEQRVPAYAVSERGWACLRFLGPFAFDETGIVLAVIRPLSENGIGVFIVSTFDGDHLLLKQSDLDRATALLEDAGHQFV